MTGKTISAKGTMFTNKDKNDETKDITLTVVTAFGGTIEKKITVCEEAPKATTLEYNEDYSSTTIKSIAKLADGTWKVGVIEGSTYTTDGSHKDYYPIILTHAKDDPAKNIIITKDQYGKIMQKDQGRPNRASYIIVVENNDGHVVAGNNGTSSVIFRTLPNKEAKVTVMVDGGSAVKAIFVIE